MRFRWPLLALGMLLWLATACASAAQPTPTVAQPAATLPPTLPPTTMPTAAPLPEAETPTALAVPSATALPAPVATDSPTAIPTLAPQSVFGVTEEGLYFRGSPNPAALVVTDYSDFL